MEQLSIEDMEISMPGFTKKIVKNKEVVYYNITLKLKSNKWKLQKRFNDFVDFHKEIALLLPRVPKLPEKTLMRKNDEAFIINRKCKLELYLLELLQIEEILGVNLFIKFLEIDQNASYISLNQI